MVVIYTLSPAKRRADAFPGVKMPGALGVRPPSERTKANLLRRGSLFNVVVFWPVFATLTFIFWRDSVAIVLALSFYANWRVDLDGWQIEKKDRD